MKPNMIKLPTKKATEKPTRTLELAGSDSFPPRAILKTGIICGSASKNAHSNGQEQLPLVKCSIV